MTGPLLAIDGVSKRFGALRALSEVTLEVARGEIVSVIGPNGAGKSTLFNVVAGLCRPDGGRIRFDGEDVTALPPQIRNRKGIAKTYQITSVFPGVSVFENVEIAALSRARAHGRLPSLWRTPDVAAGIWELLGLFGLDGRADDLARNLSHGEQRYVDMCVALATAPALLLLDEPTAGMTPAETRRAVELIRQIAVARDLTLLLIEHDMNVVMGISDRVAVLHLGEKIAEGPPDAVRNHPAVVDAYLGPGASRC